MNEQFFYNDNKTIVLVVDTEGSKAYLKLSEKCIFYDESEIMEVISKAGVSTDLKMPNNLQKKDKQLKSWANLF